MVMYMDDNFNIGRRLQTLRTSLGLSQEQVALYAGITTTYYGQIERNLKNPTVHVIEKICSAMNISLGNFFDSKDITHDHDILTEQILLQLQTCSELEKSTIYNIILQIKLLQKQELSMLNNS